MADHDILETDRARFLKKKKKNGGPNLGQNRARH